MCVMFADLLGAVGLRGSSWFSCHSLNKISSFFSKRADANKDAQNRKKIWAKRW